MNKKLELVICLTAVIGLCMACCPKCHAKTLICENPESRNIYDEDAKLTTHVLVWTDMQDYQNDNRDWNDYHEWLEEDWTSMPEEFLKPEIADRLFVTCNKTYNVKEDGHKYMILVTLDEDKGNAKHYMVCTYGCGDFYVSEVYIGKVYGE